MTTLHFTSLDIITAALSSNDENAAEGDSQQARLSRIIRSMGLTGIRQLLAQGGLTLRTQAADEDEEDDEDQVSRCRVRFYPNHGQLTWLNCAFCSGMALEQHADQAWPNSGTQSRSQSRPVRSSILVASSAK